jgi:ribonucleoside-diphosphate reductase alpha chain
MQLSQNAIQVLEKRYLAKDRTGKVIETPEQLFERVARTISGAERDESMSEYEEKFYKIMTNLEFLPNTPTLINAGRAIGQLSACFVLNIDDSMESIFTTLRDAALVQKSGGGCGYSFSNVRPSGDLVKSTNKCAGGPIAFIRIFDKAMEAIEQGGVRHGANLGTLRIDHPDIVSFIECKQKEGDIPNFNLSVGITDEFMSAVKSDRMHQLINPHTGAVVKEIKAKKLFDLIVHHAWANGEPGILFLDEMNRHNMIPNVGAIESTNPCGELPLLAYESCNLGSVNLGRFVKAEKVDYDRLEYVVRLATRFLDDVIDMNKYPISQIETKTKMTRKIGLGIMGFADMLIKLNIQYDTEEAVRYASDVMRKIRQWSIDESSKLAEVRGVFPAWRGSRWQTDEGVRLRNAGLTAIAPTGTLSIIANASSGCEPYYSKTVKKHVINTILEEEVEYAKSDCFITAKEISPEWHVKIQAALQAQTCSAVSKTINFPNDATEDDIKRSILLAYKLKCKGIALYRDGSREKQVLYSGDAKKDVVPTKEKAIEKCPECGADVVNESGCVKCSNAGCGWSACKIS